jgi:signal transduction histidine kinase
VLKNKSLIEDFAISDTIASIIRHDISPMIQDEIPRALDGLQNAIQGRDAQLLQQTASVTNIFKKLKQIFSALSATSLLSVRKLPFKSSSFDLIRVFEASQVLENNLKPQVKLIFEKNEPCWVRADRILVEILLRNLIQNAINHTHKGKIRIFTSEYDDDFIQVSVCDTGEGISDEMKETIFNVGNSAKNKNGHGFGLVLCQHIIAKHKDSKIGVVSKMGEGSTFYFTLKKANINK